MAKPTQPPKREGTIPCYQCPCIAICRIKIKQYDGTNMWGRVWNFVFDNQCELIYNYVVANSSQDVSLRDGFDILSCMELVHTPKPISEMMNDRELLEELLRKEKS